MQMTSSFINLLTQAVLPVKTRQLDQWKPVSGRQALDDLQLLTRKPNLL